MNAPSWEDVSEFFDDFAVDITLIRPDGNIILKGIFDDAFFLSEIGEADLTETQPRISLPTKDAVIIQRKDQIIVHDKEYDVIDNKPDGTGVSIVILGCDHND